LYASVNEQIKSYRSQQWTFAVLILTLLYGVGTFCESHKALASSLVNKAGLTGVILLIALAGSIHLGRLQAFVKTHKKVRQLLEHSFGFKGWTELTRAFSLLGSKQISFAGDSFELVLWVFSILLLAAGSSYIIWHL
jgi:hypothetical protein